MDAVVGGLCFTSVVVLGAEDAAGSVAERDEVEVVGLVDDVQEASVVDRSRAPQARISQEGCEAGSWWLNAWTYFREAFASRLLASLKRGADPPVAI